MCEMAASWARIARMMHGAPVTDRVPSRIAQSRQGQMVVRVCGFRRMSGRIPTQDVLRPITL